MPLKARKGVPLWKVVGTPSVLVRAVEVKDSGEMAGVMRIVDVVSPGIIKAPAFNKAARLSMMSVVEARPGTALTL